MTTKVHDHQAIKQQLESLEQELKRLELWGGADKAPSMERMAKSAEFPFGVSVLEAHEWLEYVLLYRLQKLIACGQQLPSFMQTHSYAEEVYKHELDKYQDLINILKGLDQLVSIEDNDDPPEDAQ